MHGYDLLAEYQRQEIADWASISKAQLYYALKKLDGFGLLRGALTEGIARDRTVYKLTAAGHRALAQGLADPSWSSGRVAQPFVTWFGLSLHATREARKAIFRARLAFLDIEIEKEQRSLAYISTLMDPRAKLGGEVVRLIIQQLQVEREWLQGLVARAE